MPPKKDNSITWTTFWSLLILAVVLGAYYRFPVLSKRPMHTDEAILAVKTTELWNTGRFDYDPTDFHGPALHYLTCAVAKLDGWGATDAWTETELRCVVAVCGFLLLLLPLAAGDALGRHAAIMATLLIAVSPMQVFYSRYYIMEMLLALEMAVFLLACWRYSQSRNRMWLIGAGIALGLAHTTKETFVIPLAAAGCALVALRVFGLSFEAKASGLRLSSSSSRKKASVLWPWIVFPAAAVSVTLYSGFFKDWQAVQESVTTYASYLKRSGGAGGHEKPFYYYLMLIFWRKDGLLWTEALIGGLGVVGALHAFLGTHKNNARQAVLIFLTVYTLAIFTAFSILPYKTPWAILCGQHALILLAGAGVAGLWSAIPIRFIRMLLGIGLALGVWHLCRETMLSIHEYRADSRNPYVYSHTTVNAMQLVDRIRELEATQPEGFGVQVINVDSGWPLPWYLRDMKDVGYQTQVPAQLHTPVIVADIDQEALVQQRLDGREFQNAGIYSLRSGMNVVLFVQKGLWDAFMSTRQAPPSGGAATPPLVPATTPPVTIRKGSVETVPAATTPEPAPAAPGPAVPAPAAVPAAPDAAPTPAPAEHRVMPAQPVTDQDDPSIPTPPAIPAPGKEKDKPAPTRKAP